MPGAADGIDRGRDLLFVALALQMSFVDRPQFVEVMTLLPSRTDRTAGRLGASKTWHRHWFLPSDVEPNHGIRLCVSPSAATTPAPDRP